MWWLRLSNFQPAHMILSKQDPIYYTSAWRFVGLWRTGSIQWLDLQFIILLPQTDQSNSNEPAALRGTRFYCKKNV